MKLVMTLFVRNEADIIDAQIAFHLNAGVDFIIATDHGSDDGTAEILDSYARQGRLHCIRNSERHLSQVDSVTQMARLAATDFGADWVINSDGDEFWWPRGGNLKEILAAVPRRFGSVRGMWRHFVPRPPGDGFFAERMTVRLCAPVTDENHPFNPHFKTAHRADPEVRVGGGNHDAIGRDLLPLRSWYPIDVLHFRLRSFEQSERKYVQHYEWRGGSNLSRHMVEAYEAYQQGRMREFYESFVIDDEALERGLRDGTLAVDTRLRDALRLLRVDANGNRPRFALGRPLSFAVEAVDQGYLSELGALANQDSLVALQRRLEVLETRLSRHETRLPARLRARLSLHGSH